MNRLFPRAFPASSIKVQLVLGILCGVLNYLLIVIREFIREFFKIPLFLDTVFTMLASFYGPAAGCIAAFLCHLFAFLFDTNSNLLWVICSLTIVLVIRLFSRNGKPVSWTGIVWILILTVVLITVEGTIIASLLYFTDADYLEPSSLSTSVFVLLASGVSYFAVAFLVRLPVNLIDKTVSLILALLVYFLAAKIRRLYSKRKE